MELVLTRKKLTGITTIGELTIDGKFECYTLEDTYRPPPEVKVKGDTCIPCGRYLVTIERSPRFQIDMPRLHDVPDFIGILMHTGNVPADTEGCILVGTTMGENRIDNSRLAFASLFLKLRAAQNRGEPIHITVQLETT